MPVCHFSLLCVCISIFSVLTHNAVSHCAVNQFLKFGRVLCLVNIIIRIVLNIVLNLFYRRFVFATSVRSVCNCTGTHTSNSRIITHSFVDISINFNSLSCYFFLFLEWLSVSYYQHRIQCIQDCSVFWWGVVSMIICIN